MGISTARSAAEARRAKSGLAFLRRGSQPLPTSYGAGGAEERCKLPQQSLGRSSRRQAVLPIFKCTRWLFLQQYFG